MTPAAVDAECGQQVQICLSQPIQPPEPAGDPVLFQAFEWHLPGDHQHWKRLRVALPDLKAIGIDTLWLPPGSKGANGQSNGYDIYDPYDLGEFDQKGTVATKWGTKQDLVELAAAGKALGVGLLWDAILNHRAFADEKETVRVVEVDPRDRRVDITDPYDIQAWTKFNFTGRAGKYSTFTYDKRHFNATDWNDANQKRAIYRFADKQWATDVGSLQGNADYLMFENLDYSNPELVQETNGWGRWIVRELGLDGFRLDAVQHYSRAFVNRWAKLLMSTSTTNNGRPLLFVGEFWSGDVHQLTEWLHHMSPHFKLYDVPLMYNIHKLSMRYNSDLREVFNSTLVERMPENAVTFIRNHDTQRGQDMDTPIDRAFTPHAHALMLLRQAGQPCVFHGDLYGTGPPDREPPTCFGKLPGLILARQLYAHGPQTDYFERPDCIGWVRDGTGPGSDGRNGCAVILSWTTGTDFDSVAPRLSMCVGRRHAGEVWTDLLGFEWAAVTIDADGFGCFPCQANSMACFVSQDAVGRDRFPVRFDADFFSKPLDDA